MTGVLPLEKLVKLIPLLASPIDGEVVATARAIGRVLIEAGCDFHDLANAVGGSASARLMSWPSPSYPASSAPRPAPPKPPSWAKLTPSRRAAWLVLILNAVSINIPERDCRYLQKVLALIEAGGSGASRDIGKDAVGICRRYQNRAFSLGLFPQMSGSGA